jgi:hypothetical protein
LVVCAAASTGVFAEEKKGQEKPAAPAKQEMKMQTADLIVLIKSTIMALQHANQTGNYSVLRDMGSPIFRERFDQAALTAVFSNLRSRGVNLVPVLFLAPNLSKQPEMLAGNELQLVGNFATQPLQIQYDMRFLFLDGVWRLNALSVDAVPVQQPVASAAPQVQNAAPQVQSAAAAAPGGQAAKPSNASAGSKGKKVAQPASQ